MGAGYFKTPKFNKRFRQIISVVVALVIMMDGIYVPGIQGIWGMLGALPGKVWASVSDGDVSGNDVISLRRGALLRSAGVGSTTKNIGTLRELYEYSAEYKNDSATHCNDELIINIGADEEWILEDNHVFGDAELTYYPLGTLAHPFGGSIRYVQASNNGVLWKLNVPMFDYILDSVDIKDNSADPQDISMTLVRSEDLKTTENEALFAQHVQHDGSGDPATWHIIAGAADDNNAYSFSGVLGEVGTGAIVDLEFSNQTHAEVKSAVIYSTSNVGLICGRIYDNANVNVTLSGNNTDYSVTTTNGAAGGLAGIVDNGAALTVTLNGFNLSAEKTITGTTYAGGLAGICNGGTVTIRNMSEETVQYTSTGTIVGNTAAGGVFGFYKTTSDNTDLTVKYAVSDCAINSSIAGGLFGILENDANMTIGNGSRSATETVTATKDSVNIFGGLIGEYHTNDLKNTLEILKITVNTGATGNSVGCYGGAIGKINSVANGDAKGTAAAYVKADNFIHNSTAGYGNTNGCFGGVVGDAGTSGSMLDIGTVTISTMNGLQADHFYGGGIVGKLERGVLRLSGITAMTNAPAHTVEASGSSVNRGQLVGIREDALVYALGNGESESASYGNGWRFVRSARDAFADDIGTWGEVVRIENIESNVVNWSSSDHTVTLKAAEINMGNAAAFVKTALNMQLNGGSNIGALCFDDPGNSKKTVLLESSTTLSITNNIDLSGTGITGFMRDNYRSKNEIDTEIGLFKGTLDGKGNTLRIATGERYGIYEGDAVGRGAIFTHCYNGLFARTGSGAQIKDLELAGSMIIDSEVNDMYVGGIAAVVTNGIILTDVNVSETINFKRLGGDSMYIGGIIGLVSDKNANAITIKSDEGRAEIKPVINVTGTLRNNDKTNFYHVIGGGIGYVQSKEKFTITFKNILLSAKVSAESSNSISNISIAGLLADLTWNGDGDDTKDVHKVILDDILVKSTAITSNSTNNSGGILGYRWYNTNAEIQNVKLQMNESEEGDARYNVLSTSAQYACGLVYRATGHWEVKANGIIIDSFKANLTTTTTNDTNRSFGLILNDGYYSNSGLYLELKDPTSYQLASSDTGHVVGLPTGYALYDEIVVFTSNRGILTNGIQGIISIATTGNQLYMDGTNCNTYQNKYKLNSTNPYSRYYYNITSIEAKENKSNGEKLLMWSLNRYAAKNLKTYFTNPYKVSDTEDTISGTGEDTTFDLRNLSYYPINVGDDNSVKTVNVSDITLVFYNDQIEASEGVASGSGNTDGEVRTTRGTSQHSMMHSGLFKNVTGTVNITGDVHFKGSIGAGTWVGVNNSSSASFSGALINGTLTGTLSTNTEKEIVLEGITVKKADGTSGDSLLINKIETNGNMTLSGVRTGGGKNFSNASKHDTETRYAAGATVAGSLIGDVSGNKIKIIFNRMQLDSRTAVNSVDGDAADTALTEIYGTTKSIFSNATLLNSFKVDVNSVGTYNYNLNEDWNGSTHLGHVTYGKEIGNGAPTTESQSTVEYWDEDENESQQQMYYDQAGYTSPVSNNAAGAYAFSSGNKFLPYVAVAYQTGTYRELKVNVRAVGLTDGCGTYNHPYEIDTGKQFVALAKAINGTTLPDSIRLPKVNGANVAEKNAQCTNKADCELFTHIGSNYVYPETGEVQYTWTETEMRHYLAGAYYLVKKNSNIIISAKSGYPGLGAPALDGTGGEFAFSGVIVGERDESGNCPTIKNMTKVSAVGSNNNYNTMGLISMSNGSVVKDLNIKVVLYSTAARGTDVKFDYKAENNLAYGYDENLPNYGAVMNKIMGGDNIIDNVAVQYESDTGTAVSFKVRNSNDYRAVVGGYVGAVVNGGLIFRNIDNESLTGFNVVKVNDNGETVNVTVDGVNLTADGKGLQDGADYAHLWVNPFVGRVINGYVVRETNNKYSFSENGQYGDGVTRNSAVQTTLKNTTKNYSIPDINKTGSKLTFSKSADGNLSVYDTVTVPDGQALYIMAAITQSGSGCAASETGSYNYAISYDGINSRIGSASAYRATHKAQYDHVGEDLTSEILNNVNSDYNIAKTDTVNSFTAVPYIIYQYTQNCGTADAPSYPARVLTTRKFFIELANSEESIVYYLPDSFRGIGYLGSKGDTDNAMNDNMKIYGLDGHGNKIDVNIDFHGYTKSYDPYYEKNLNGINTGVALFNKLNQYNTYNGNADTSYKNEAAYQIGGFTLTGYITADMRNNSGDKISRQSEGDNNSLDFYAAGVVSSAVRSKDGYEKYYNFANISFMNMRIKAVGTTGGFISRMTSGKVYINNSNASGLTVEGGAMVGGFIGKAEARESDSGIHVNVNAVGAKSTLSDIVVKQTSNATRISNNDNNDVFNYAGGIIGYYSGYKAVEDKAFPGETANNYGSLLIRNVTIEGGDPDENFIGSAFSDNPQGYVGGIIGSPMMAKGCLILDCNVKNINIYGKDAGGLVGAASPKGNYVGMRVSGCTVEGTTDEAGKPDYVIRGSLVSGGVVGYYNDDAVGFEPMYRGKEYTACVDDCLIKGYDIEQTINQTLLAAGGIAGSVQANKLTVANTKVEGCTIKCNGASNQISMGGIVGFLYNNKALLGYNIAVCNNIFDNVAVHNSTYNNIAPYGNLVGRVESNGVVKVAGYTSKGNTVVKGFGNNKAEDKRAVEYELGRIWNSDYKTNVIPGNFDASSYIIYADYDTSCAGQTDEVGGAIEISNLATYANGEASVATPGSFPYVTYSPQTAMGTGAILTGDGPAIDENTAKPLAQKVLTEGNLADKYYITTDSDKAVVTAMLPVESETEQDVKLTTWQTEMDALPEGVDDFAIITLGGAASGGLYTDQITSYIRLLTNTSYDYMADVSGIYRINIYPCQYIDGKYQIVDGTAGLSRDNSNRYKMTDANADTLQSNQQFSLIDVQFYNPFNTAQIAYHLYVPVLTKKMVKYNFRASALENTKYERTKYTVGNKLAGNFDSWITMYIQYEYPKTEMDTLLATGKGLNWNNNKIVNLRYSIRQDVADSTQFILLDNNNNVDKEYYLTKEDIAANTSIPQGGYATDKVALNAFADANSTPFSLQNLNDIAGTKVVYSNDVEAENRIYTPVAEGTEGIVAYAYDSNHENKLFFKKADGTEEENAKYALTVNGTVTESYYLSMYAYGKDNVYDAEKNTHNAYEFTVVGQDTIDGTVPIRKKEESRATVILGNLFEQTLDITDLVEETRMGIDNHELTATLTSVVNFKNSDNKSYFQDRLSSQGISLYQGFMVYLNRYEADNELAADQTIKGSPVYSYTLTTDGGGIGTGENSMLDGDAPYLYIEPVNITIPSSSENPNWESTQTAQVTFTFATSETELQTEFPLRNDDVSRAGISFYASANLAYSSDQVKYSGQTARKADDTKRYYTDKSQKMDLTLTALDQDIDDGYDQLGEQSKNRSSLGINAKYIDTGLKFNQEGNYQHIDAAVNLDVSQLPDTILDGTYSLQFQCELQQKQDASNANGYQYNRVGIDTYLKDFQLKGKSAELTEPILTSTENGVYKYSIPLTGEASGWPIEYKNQQFSARLSFDVKTGSELEHVTNYLYSNYKVVMTAQIVKTDNTSVGYEGDTDCIVYTNAKVNAQYVNKTPSP